MGQLTGPVSCIFVLVLVGCLCPGSQAGPLVCAEFVTAIMAPNPPLVTSNDVTFRLVITNPSQTFPANVTIQPLGNNMTIPPKKMDFSVVVNVSQPLTGSQKQALGVGVVSVTSCSADNDVNKVSVVQAIMETDVPRSKVVVAVPSVSSLANDYVIITHCVTARCFTGIVAVSPDVTQVNVTLRLRHSTSDVTFLPPTLTYNGQAYSDGDVIQESLQQYQAMQILCQLCDMSGSRVMSSQPVAVLAGGELTSLTEMPPRVHNNTVVDFMPPVHALSTRHVVALDTLNDVGVVKVVALYNGTRLQVPGFGQCFNLVTDEPGFTWTLPFPRASNSTVIDSSFPVLAALIVSRDPVTSSADDVTMVVLRPVAQWQDDDHLALQLDRTQYPDSTMVHHHIILIANDLAIDNTCVKMNGTRFDPFIHGTAVIGWPGMMFFKLAISNFAHLTSFTCSASPPCKLSTCTVAWGYVRGCVDGGGKGWALPFAPVKWKALNATQGAEDLMIANCSVLDVTVTSTTMETTTSVSSSEYTTSPEIRASSGEAWSTQHGVMATATSPSNIVSTSAEMAEVSAFEVMISETAPLGMISTTVVDDQFEEMTTEAAPLNMVSTTQDFDEVSTTWNSVADTAFSSYESDMTSFVASTPSIVGNSAISLLLPTTSSSIVEESAAAVTSTMDEIPTSWNSVTDTALSLYYSDMTFLVASTPSIVDNSATSSLLLPTTSLLPTTTVVEESSAVVTTTADPTTASSKTTDQDLTSEVTQGQDTFTTSSPPETSPQHYGNSTNSAAQFQALTTQQTGTFKKLLRAFQMVNGKCSCVRQSTLAMAPENQQEGQGIISITSRQRNRKECARDFRTSATLIGVSGVATLVVVGVIILSFDVLHLLGVGRVKFAPQRRRPGHNSQ